MVARKDNAARYENCVDMPIRFSRDNDKRALIHQIELLDPYTF